MLWAQLFFFASVLGLAGALNSLRTMAPDKHPIRRPLWIPMLITAELVPLRILSRVAFGGLFIWAGALDFRAGRIALWLTLATWAIYVILLRRAFATRRLMATTLTAAGVPVSSARIDWRRALPAWILTLRRRFSSSSIMSWARMRFCCVRSSFRSASFRLTLNLLIHCFSSLIFFS